MSEMARIQAPPNLPALVKAAFQKARSNGDLTYYPTQATILTVGSVPFQLRYSPALAAKPKAPVQPRDQPAAAKPFNPFADPDPALLVAALPPSHRLVLNKFAVVPEHFILATRAFKPQTHVLEPADVAAAYACIDAYARADGGQQDLFVFFNSGQHSGASQPHRHLQLLPVARMRDGLERVERGGGWDVLADKLGGGEGASVPELEQQLPFAVLAAAVSPDASAEARHTAYVDLYKRAVRAVLSAPAGGAADEEEADVPGDGEAKISYNFAMTRNSMALCPRTAEGAVIRNRAGVEVGQVALNGTLLAGTALVKTQAEWDALVENPSLLHGVLGQIGIKPSKL
ncbi:bifunctional AP-4-A phosphorylase/ADP sulfurylase [Diatrype stigma]|uniref:Bifunctional AP-4-A phosphorylase/ADP sulfurylase n=1 Tax=Diatrype stigma TaxID=117547 RepID=A0AAN9UD00_9PEZI